MYFIGHPTLPTGLATTYRPERKETHIIALLDICILYLPSTITFFSPAVPRCSTRHLKATRLTSNTCTRGYLYPRFPNHRQSCMWLEWFVVWPAIYGAVKCCGEARGLVRCLAVSSFRCRLLCTARCDAAECALPHARHPEAAPPRPHAGWVRPPPAPAARR